MFLFHSCFFSTVLVLRWGAAPGKGLWLHLWDRVSQQGGGRALGEAAQRTERDQRAQEDGSGNQVRRQTPANTTERSQNERWMKTWVKWTAVTVSPHTESQHPPRVGLRPLEQLHFITHILKKRKKKSIKIYITTGSIHRCWHRHKEVRAAVNHNSQKMRCSVFHHC